jgi:hypothetical protein
VDSVAALGRAARVPALWLYAENDQIYGPDLARRMYAAYGAGGAPAQLHGLPPLGTNGHDTVAQAPADDWFPAVEPFLAKLGLPTKSVVEPPLFARLPSPPQAIAVRQKAFADYLSNPDDAKAFAVSTGGGCGSGFGRTSIEAREPALTKCKINTRGSDCRLYAVGQKLVEELGKNLTALDSRLLITCKMRLESAPTTTLIEAGSSCTACVYRKPYSS